MTSRKPPRLAAKLLERLTTPSVFGDLLEAFQDGRSRWWFWRQVIGSIAAMTIRDVIAHPLRLCAEEQSFSRSNSDGSVHQLTSNSLTLVFGQNEDFGDSGKEVTVGKNSHGPHKPLVVPRTDIGRGF
jgi:hypothetical protein